MLLASEEKFKYSIGSLQFTSLWTDLYAIEITSWRSICFRIRTYTFLQRSSIPMAAKDSGRSASSSPPPSNSGPGQYLKDLPSRGFFTNAIPSSSPGGLRVYICDHDTSPPENQIIKTDSTNILIRSLTLNKSKGDSKLKDVNGKTAAETSKGKRPAERPAEEKMLAKRASIGSNPGSSKKEGGSVQLSEREIQMSTVDRLRSLLRERGLSTKGKKEELISRLRQ